MGILVTAGQVYTPAVTSATVTGVKANTSAAAHAPIAQGSANPPGTIVFDGINDYIEIADSPNYSISTTGSLTVSAWMRPDVIDFPDSENGYVHWLGKGVSGQHEWVFRIYNFNNTPENRPNRISFYVFNLAGGLGVGSYFQETVTAGQWIHVVGVADGNNTNIYKNGVFKDSDPYTSGSLIITPQNGTAPVRIGTRDFASFFLGAIHDVIMWNRALTAGEISALYTANTVPQNGLVLHTLNQ